MRVIEAGHVYELDHLDGDGKSVLVVYVNREDNPHEGTQTQEILRAQIDINSVLIDRTNHCDSCLRWEGNDRIIKAISESQRQLRLALLYHEQRALERKMEKGKLLPETLPVAVDGHIQIKENVCIWTENQYENANTECGYVVNDYPHGTRNMVNESYTDHPYKFCYGCGRKIKFVPMKEK